MMILEATQLRRFFVFSLFLILFAISFQVEVFL